MSNEQEQLLGLYWKGKKTTVDKILLPFQNLEVIETINESRATREKEKGTMFKNTPTFEEGEWRNKLIWGDNKYALAALTEKFAGKIDLIYIDPPFATGANFSTTITIGDDEIEATKEASAIEELAYRDTWGKGLDSFLQMMYDRLVIMRELLSEKGTIYIHLDWHVGHYAKIILDEIFGYDNFVNEIIWQKIRTTKAQSMGFGNVHDVIFLYSKTDKATFKNEYTDFDPNYISSHYKKEEKTNRLFRTVSLLQKGNGPARKFGTKTLSPPAGMHWIWSQDRIDEAMKNGIIRFTSNGRPEKIQYLDEMKGDIIDDLWTDIYPINSQANESVKYPTQKPEALLERIIRASSNEGDLIADFFCGSGTTAVVAEKLGRRWITSDLGRFSIHTARKRFLEIEDCKPFEILNIGRYERHYWHTNLFGKKTQEQSQGEYLQFILNLYKAKAVAGSANIHGQKGKEVIHVGSVEAPVTREDIYAAAEEAKRMQQNNLTVLGWEYEMGLHSIIDDEVKEKFGIKLKRYYIPHTVMDKRAVDAGDVKFYEQGYLEIDVKKDKNWGVKLKVTDFHFDPNSDIIPDEVKKQIKKWTDYIDYWSVDWDYKNDTFHNQWQSYRTKRDRSLQLETDPHQYAKKGTYKVMVKVIDIFGNDTTQILEVTV